MSKPKAKTDGWMEAIKAAHQRAYDLHGTDPVHGAGQRTLTANTFLCGVEWAIKHKDILNG